MTRSIRAVGVHRPAYAEDGRWREGPDEDGITLAVRALERLRAANETWSEPVDTIHLLGAFPAEAEWAIPEAIGAPSVAVQRHHDGLAAALFAAGHVGGAGTSLVMVADVPPPGAPEGSGAVVFELAGEAGWTPLGHAGRRHPPYRVPDGKAWVAEGARAGAMEPGDSPGTLLFVATATAPVILRAWKSSFPRHAIIEASSEPPGLGASPLVPYAIALAKLQTDPSPAPVAVAAFLHAETTEFLGLKRASPVAWAGPQEFPAATGPPAPSRPPADVVRAVSEGAHVPRPRYLENLPSRWRYLADQCSHCKALSFPRRGRCRQCGARDGLTELELPREGVVEAATVVAPGAHPTEFDPLVSRTGGYGVVLLRLEEGVRATAMVAPGAAGTIAVGDRMSTELRRLYPIEGEWRYGRKAVPIVP